MKTAEEIIKEHPAHYTLMEGEPTELIVYDLYMVKHMINLARKECIEECANSVQQNYNLTIDKQSILNLINELK